MVRVSLRTVTLNIPPQNVITLRQRARPTSTPSRTSASSTRTRPSSTSRTRSRRRRRSPRRRCARCSARPTSTRCCRERERLNEDLQQIIDEQTEPWGIKVSTVEIKDVGIPTTMQRAMARQAEAERERRAKVIHAEGELQAAAKLSEAAGVLSADAGGDPAALPADALGDRRRAELDDRLPAPDRPDQAAAVRRRGRRAGARRQSRGAPERRAARGRRAPDELPRVAVGGAAPRLPGPC